MIGIDYFFITAGGVRTSAELMEETEHGPDGQTPAWDEYVEQARGRGDVVKCLVIRDFHSQGIFARMSSPTKASASRTPWPTL